MATMTAPDPDMQRLVVVDGVEFPKTFETNRPMKEQIECIKALQLRDDDVFLLAYPKCGTHWLWEMGSMLLTGKADYHSNTKEFAMLEAAQIEKTQALPSPRLLNTHVPVAMLPRELKAKKVKVIHVYRNVKDVVVSYYYHIKQVVKDLALEDTIGTISRPGISYFKYLKEMDEFFKENPEIPVFNVSYEEIAEDPVGVVTRLAEFLGVPHSPEFCLEVADACNFHKLKQAHQSKECPSHIPNIQMYRKGEVGDWKNHLTVAQSERLDAAMKELDGCNFRFRYTL